MIRPTKTGRYSVTTDSGQVVAITESRAQADWLDARRGHSKAVQVQVAPTLYAALLSRAVTADVPLTTYVRSVLEAHVEGRETLEHRQVKPGLGAASTRTRKKVSRAGVKGRKNKETERG